MKLRLDLLRHGETTLSHTLRGSTDDELTVHGWSQMQQTIQSVIGQADSALRWDAIFTSPLKRCLHFAQRLADQHQLIVNIDANLQEMHFGDWEGLSTQQIYENDPELLAHFWQQPTQFSPPNAETLPLFHSRIQHALHNIQQQMLHANLQNALVITHGGVIKLLKCMALQQPFDDVLKMSAELGQLNRFSLDSENMRLVCMEHNL